MRSSPFATAGAALKETAAPVVAGRREAVLAPSGSAGLQMSRGADLCQTLDFDQAANDSVRGESDRVESDWRRPSICR